MSAPAIIGIGPALKEPDIRVRVLHNVNIKNLRAAEMGACMEVINAVFAPTRSGDGRRAGECSSCCAAYSAQRRCGTRRSCSSRSCSRRETQGPRRRSARQDSSKHNRASSKSMIANLIATDGDLGVIPNRTRAAIHRVPRCLHHAAGVGALALKVRVADKVRPRYKIHAATVITIYSRRKIAYTQSRTRRTWSCSGSKQWASHEPLPS